MSTPVRIPYPAELLKNTEEPLSVIKSVGCRPFSGRSMMRWFSITVPTPTLRVSTCEALASTWTDSLTCPTPSVIAISGLLLTCSTIPVCT